MRISNLQIPNSKQSGFTLIEAIVSTAVFAFVITSILGVYIAVLRLDTRTRAIRAVAADARFIMDFLAKEVRNGRVDYASYPNQLTCKTACGTAEYSTDLYLINQNNEQERFYFRNRATGVEQTNSDCRSAGSVCDLYLSKGGNSTRLNSSNVRVTFLRIQTAPWGDPFAAARNYNQQPNVTVTLELVGNNVRDAVKINLESTFSTLYYPARP